MPEPGDLNHYALFEQACSIEQSYFDPIVSAIAFEKVFKPRKGLGPTDEARVAKLAKELDTTLEVYNRILSSQPYLAGREITVADLFHLPYGTMVEGLGFAELFEKYPHVNTWWNSLKARQSWQSIIA